MIINYEKCHWKIEIPFNRYTSIEEDMVEYFNGKDLFEKYAVSKVERYKKYIDFLSAIDIYTVQWAKKME